MRLLLRDEIENSLTILSELVASRHNPASTSPPPAAIRAALKQLSNRLNCPHVVVDALHDLNASPPKYSIKVFETAGHILEQSDQARKLSAQELEADSKAQYLRSIQYGDETVLNWSLLVASLAMAVYLVYFLLLSGRTISVEQGLKWGVFALPALIAIVMSYVQKRTGRDSIHSRFFRYQALYREHLTTYREWLLRSNPGIYGQDARVTRRQGRIILLFCVLGWGIAVFHLSP